MKLGLVVGHTARAPGAVRQDTGEAEFFWNKDLALRAKRYAHQNSFVAVKIFYRPEHLGYKSGLRAAYGEADAWKVDFTNELHFNSHRNPNATGTEVLSSGSPLSLKFADVMQKEMIEALGLKDRGVKVVTPTDRGGFNLVCGKAPAILIEPFFGSSAAGLAATDEDHEKEALARALIKAAERMAL